MHWLKPRDVRTISGVAFGILISTFGVSISGCSQTEGGLALPYEVVERPVLPFPTDAIAVPADTPTGLRIDLGQMGTNLGDVDEALFLFGEDFARAMTKPDGWSAVSPSFLRAAAPVDLDSAQAHFLVIDLSSNLPVALRRKAFGGKTDYGRETYWVSGRPQVPLVEGTRHAIVGLRGLASESGEIFSRAPQFLRVLEGGSDLTPEESVAHARLRPLLDALPDLGIDADDILVADVFTTQTITGHVQQYVDAIRALPAPTVTLDGDGDGDFDIYADPFSDPKNADYPDARFDYSSIRAIVRAQADIPSFRLDEDAPLVLGADGQPQRLETVEALFIVPKGTGPFPVVVYQHGLGNQKESIYIYGADEMARRGIAVVAFDAPIHGFRTDRPGNAGGKFINIVFPNLVVDNLNQLETDHVSFVRVIEQLAQVDVFSTGEALLDLDRIFYLGNSLGAIGGSVSLAFEPRYKGAVLNVGGGALLEFFDRFLSGLELNEFPAELFTVVAQTALDRGDPVNFGRHSKDKPILLLQAMQDELVPARASEALARSFGLPQVAPVFGFAEGVEVLQPPVFGSGWTQFDAATHSLSWSDARAPEAYNRSRDQMFHYLSTWAADGVGEIR